MNSKYLRRAIELASENVRSGRGGPFGAVIVRGDELIAEGVNEVTASHDPTAHAEVAAIRHACAMLGSHELRRCDIYASCEPCPMCLGAIYWARLDRLYFAATQKDAAEAGFDDSLIYTELAKPLASRQLPSTLVPIDGATTPFLLWRTSVGKIPY